MARSSLGTQLLHSSAGSFQQNTVTLGPIESYEESSSGFLNLESAFKIYEQAFIRKKLQELMNRTQITLKKAF